MLVGSHGIPYTSVVHACTMCSACVLLFEQCKLLGKIQLSMGEANPLATNATINKEQVNYLYLGFWRIRSDSKGDSKNHEMPIICLFCLFPKKTNSFGNATELQQKHTDRVWYSKCPLNSSTDRKAALFMGRSQEHHRIIIKAFSLSCFVFY